MPDYEDLMIKVLLALSFLVFTSTTFADDFGVVTDSFGMLVRGQYPTQPNDDLTPGGLCDSPDSYRYPEHIAYCQRNVDGSLKAEIIREYDSKLGFHIQQMNRVDFKIDHYIPLCMGGSNGRDNLWPQHKSVFEATDRIEEQLCRLMEKARMLQREAITIMRRAKNNLDEAPRISQELAAKLK